MVLDSQGQVLQVNEQMVNEKNGADQSAQELRHEIKFVAQDTELHRLLHWLKLNPAGFWSQYPDRIINNIYFDTLELSAYAENLSGVASRSKVRYRWYGESRSPAAGTLEINRKRNQYGWKLRYPVKQAPYPAGADWQQIRAALMSQIPVDGRFWLQVACLPVLINRYRRRYFVSADQSIRATIDTDNEVWDQRLKCHPDFETPGNPFSLMIVELKFAREKRQAASDLLSGIPIRVSRCSKYMSGVSLHS